MVGTVKAGDLYLRLGELIANMPNLASLSGGMFIPVAFETWLADVYACVSESGELYEAAQVRTMVPLLLAGSSRPAQVIQTALYRAYAVAKLKAPAQAVSSFVAVGNQHDAFKTLAKVLTEAQHSLFIVDPYLDHTILDDFLMLPNVGVVIRMLTSDKPQWLATLKPAATKWVQQHGSNRPLEVRFVSGTQLHDRDIILDNTSGYSVTQSFKDIAKRSPAAILSTGNETALMKLAAYDALWVNASVIA